MKRMINAFSRVIRAPALQFLFIGGLIFTANMWWKVLTQDNASRSSTEELVITAVHIEQLRRDWTGQTGFPPTPQQERALIEAAIDQEVLYREALALGLDRRDIAIRRRLIQIARFVAEGSEQDEEALYRNPEQDDEAMYQKALELRLDRSDLVVRRRLVTMMGLILERVPTEQAPSLFTDAELENYLKRHPERFIEPWHVQFTHVYLGEDRRGARAKEDALRLLDKLRAQHIKPADAPGLGDPFLLGYHFLWKSRAEIEQLLGPRFASSITELQVGVWLGPIPSSYGWHLVWVHATRPAGMQALDEVRNQVLQAVLKERRKQRLRDKLRQLRTRYSVRVEYPVNSRGKLSGRDSDG
ncbi:MAG TPA: peptidyl-prolyl cis-trans isomerase [Thermodesulfobacteriota bacterium]|nr:peptidyl-prolyl cis-trans isomerase [Thermodesulfobacteriota bacterium]